MPSKEEMERMAVMQEEAFTPEQKEAQAKARAEILEDFHRRQKALEDQKVNK